MILALRLVEVSLLHDAGAEIRELTVRGGEGVEARIWGAGVLGLGARIARGWSARDGS